MTVLKNNPWTFNKSFQFYKIQGFRGPVENLILLLINSLGDSVNETNSLKPLLCQISIQA